MGEVFTPSEEVIGGIQKTKFAQPPFARFENRLDPGALQMRNETDDEVVVFAYGAPPVQAGSDMLDDLPLPPES